MGAYFVESALQFVLPIHYTMNCNGKFLTRIGRLIIMKLIGNILWFVFGGLLNALAWLISGALWCLSIVGIPYGLQCFKFARLSLWPFGKEIDYGGGAVSMIANIIWVVFFGIEMALANLAIGALWCITIVGIPFGMQFFKLAKLSFMPFGAEIREIPE